MFTGQKSWMLYLDLRGHGSACRIGTKSFLAPNVLEELWDIGSIPAPILRAGLGVQRGNRFEKAIIVNARAPA